MTLHILGMGRSHPTTVISNEFLHEIGGALSQSNALSTCGVKERRSILPLEYIKSTRNADPSLALGAVMETPTDLAERAVREAISRAGISFEQIGLVIGDAISTFQLTPSEAQRVTSRFGAKIPSYDLVASSSAFCAHINTLSEWTADRMPEYVLCFSTNTPTLSIDYDKRVDGAYFGDGAAAMVVSSRHPGKIQVRDSSFVTQPSGGQSFFVDSFGHLQMTGEYLESYVIPKVKEAVKRAATVIGSAIQKAYFIGPQVLPHLVRAIATSAEFSDDRVLTNGEIKGDSFGSSAMSIIAECWDSLVPGSHIFVSQVGSGLSDGFVNLQVKS